MEKIAIIPSFDTWTTVFLLAAVHGFILGYILFRQKKGIRRANLLLGAFILMFALTLVDYVGYWTGYNIYFPNVRGFYEFLVLLYGPVLYFYFKELNEVRLRPRHWLHLLPAVVFFVLKKGADWQAWFPSNLAYLNAEALLFVGHLVSYAILCGIYVRKIEPEKRHPQRVFIWLFWGFIAGWVSYYVLIRTTYFLLVYDYSISLAMTAFIYAVGYMGLRNSTFFLVEGAVKDRHFPKYQNSTLTKGASQSIAKKLLAYMEMEKPYLENDLRISTLAGNMDVSLHNLSQVLNEELGKSFPEMINEYRLEAAKQLLKAPRNKGSYIIDIAYQAGFNNKTTFNKLFKEATGLSPSDYRKKQLAEQAEGVG